MAIILSFSADSPRGPVNLTADLTELKSYEVSEEIRKFFNAVISLRCCIREQEEEMQKIRDSIAPISAKQYHPAEQEDIMVMS